MNEKMSNTPDAVVEKQKSIERRKQLSLELFESKEVFPFPGIDQYAYEKLKEDEQYTPEGYVTPIDELIKKFEAEGMKIERGQELKTIENQTSVVTVVPAESEAGFYGENLLHIKNLSIGGDMDSRLIELIHLTKI